MPNLKMAQHHPHGDYQQLREEYELPVEHFWFTFYGPPKRVPQTFHVKFCPGRLGPTNLVLGSKQNSMRMPVTNQRAGVRTAVI